MQRLLLKQRIGYLYRNRYKVTHVRNISAVNFFVQGIINFVRGFVSQALMGALVVVKVKYLPRLFLSVFMSILMTVTLTSLRQIKHLDGLRPSLYRLISVTVSVLLNPSCLLMILRLVLQSCLTALHEHIEILPVHL